MKAFAVTEEFENSGGIIFARHDIVARRRAADEWAEGDLSCITCRRAPWADAYEGKPIPVKVMIAHGWHFECAGCGSRVDEDWLAERRLPIDGVIGTQHSQVFCCKRCARRHYRLEYRRKAREAEAVDHFKAMVRKRLPDADFCDDHPNGHHAYVQPSRCGWVWRQVAVSFRFPGMVIGPAHFRFDAAPFGRARDHGPPAPRYTVSSGDREAFEAWAARAKETLT